MGEYVHSDVLEFAGYLQIVGRGQNTGKTLSQAQAYRAMQLLLNQHIRPEQEGAFLMLLRVREESVDEIAGFTQACRETLCAQANDLSVDLDVGAYAGKRRQLPWFLLALAVLAQQGVKIMLHSSQEPQSKRLYAEHVLSQFGVYPSDNFIDAEQRLKKTNFCYMDLSVLHPKLHRLIQLREIFGLRSCANTLARLLNPSAAPYSLQGVHHKHVDQRHMLVSQRLLDPNTLCFRGEGGEPEYKASTDTQLCINRLGTTQELNIESVARWPLKDREFDINSMNKLFEGTAMHPYGESAVVGTLALILILMKEASPASAANTAKAMWDGRNPSVFFV